MSHFSETLRQLIAREGITQEDLAARSNVDRSLISRMLRDKVPSREQLAALCAAISPNQSARVELALSHLRDEIQQCLNMGGFDERHFKLELVGSGAEPAAHYFDNLPNSLKDDIHVIALESLSTPELRRVVESWAAAIRRYDEDRERKIIGVNFRAEPQAVAESPSLYNEGQKKSSPSKAVGHARATPPVPKPPATG
jgi:transcriptional regulator with XRE-family HTH domain